MVTQANDLKYRRILLEVKRGSPGERTAVGLTPIKAVNIAEPGQPCAPDGCGCCHCDRRR